MVNNGPSAESFYDEGCLPFISVASGDDFHHALLNQEEPVSDFILLTEESTSFVSLPLHREDQLLLGHNGELTEVVDFVQLFLYENLEGVFVGSCVLFEVSRNSIKLEL